MICDHCQRAADEDRPEGHCSDITCTCQHKARGTGTPAS